MRKFELRIKGIWHDVSDLYVPKSLSLQLQAFNADRKSSVSSCAFRLRYDQRLADAILFETEPVGIRIQKDFDVEFFGQIDPVFSSSWQGDLHPASISLEGVDFSVKLDETVAQSASYPASVGGEPYWIYNADDKERSILYRLLEIAGLSDRLDKKAPSIMQQIRHIAWNTGDSTYRTIIDTLLADYGWALVVTGDRLTWIRTACASMGRVDDILPDEITGSVTRNRSYVTSNGAAVIWPKTKIMEDALLWRGDLPIGDTANPRPGEPIASGDYWPEDSDIIETWQEYGVDYLDVDWLEGRSRLKNEELALISSSDQHLEDNKDEGVSLDPVDDSHEIIYEALRARLRYKNSAGEPKRLYYSQIKGRALVKTHKITTKVPSGCTMPETWQASYIYDSDSADRLARIRWMWMTDGVHSFTFSSLLSLKPGGFYRLRQGDIYDGYVQIQSALISDASPLVQYTALSTAPFRDLATSSSGSQGSGGASPGQDGASYVSAYKRSYDKPATPTGDTPVGWTLGSWPAGSEPLWYSTAKFASTGKMIIPWSEPERVTGIPANVIRYIYKRSYNKPATPAGEKPAGWTFDMIPDGYEPVWQSIGQFGETGNLVGSWTEPIRVTGETVGGYRGATDAFPTDPQDGDYILYTGATHGQYIQYHLYKFVAVDGQWVETTESDKVMAAQKDALQIAKDTGEVIYAALLFVDLLVARKLMVGGGTEYNGLLVRIMDDDGTGKPVIEIRNNQRKLFWIDFDTGQLYANFAEVVQYMPFTFNDSLDANNPAFFDFYIPEGVIDSVQVRVRAQNYRAYSLVGPGTTWTNGDKPGYSVITDRLPINIEPHSHSASLKGATEDAYIGTDPHHHGFGYSAGVSVDPAGGYTGFITYPKDIDFDLDHVHSTAFLIIETTQASGMTLSWSDGDQNWKQSQGIGSGDTRNLDINTSGWKSIRVTSATNGRVQVQVIVKIRINTEL